MQYNDKTYWKYEYNLSDHLGNVRIVFAAHSHGQPELMQQTIYYPYGMILHQQNFGGTLDQPNKILYNGKELQDDQLAGISLDWYDYGARFYDPQIGRWHVVDPLTEEYLSISPYAYVANNPIFYVDPDGREIKTHRETADDGTVTVVVTVTGKLVNESATAYTAEKLQGYADRLATSIADSYTGTGETVNFRGVANISVASDDNPLSETDHAFRIVDQGSIPGAEGKSGVLGRALFGENVVYLSEHMLDRKEATEGKNAGTGKTHTSLGTLERTGPHELGHSGNLKHPTPGTMDGNLMHQTKQPNAGKKVTEDQILQIEKDYKAGNLNKGKQKL
ncbi:MAG: RHS repeat-associated core domain-containing protein [Bacteroidales bacterium]|nr:RHS repeat-associated core domain-containing protein [Bacteroidales bacterium]